MRGEKEKFALDKITKFLFCDKLQQPIVWQGKSAFEYSDDEYKRIFIVVQTILKVQFMD